MIKFLSYLLFIAISYLMGSINNAIIICRFLGRDIRQLGSGNPGAMNMIRSVGFFWGALTLVMDALKGVIPALLGWYFLGTAYSFEGSRVGACVCALFVIIGHMFPVYYKFKGGKGVASTLGVCFVLSPILASLSFVLLLVVLLVTKIGFLGSFVGIGVPILVESVREFVRGDVIGGLFLLIILCLVIYMHKSNIQRMVEGRENKIVLFGKNKHKSIEVTTNLLVNEKKEENIDKNK